MISDKLNRPDWSVILQAIVTLAVPLVISWVFHWFNKPGNE